MTDKHSTAKGLLLLAALPFISLFCLCVVVPYRVLRHIVRWYQLPLWKRQSINARERAQRDQGYEQLETAIRAELIAHRLMDTPENRVRINPSLQRRLK